MTVKFEMDIPDLNKLSKLNAARVDKIEREIAGAMFEGGLKIEEEAKTSISQGRKSGALYKRGNVVHRASAPGEAPASDTGRLVNSIRTLLKGKTTEVGSRGTKYAGMLEFGTTKIKPRPFMQPAFLVSKDFLQQRIREAITRGLGRGTGK